MSIPVAFFFTLCVHQQLREAQEHINKAVEAQSYMKAQIPKETLPGPSPPGFRPSSHHWSPAAMMCAIIILLILHSRFVGTLSLSLSLSLTHTHTHTHTSILINAQVEYPHNPQQPGPIYFLAPRKCGLFGVCCEAVPRQVSLYTTVLTHRLY